MITEWHMFDENKGYEVREVEGGWELRTDDGTVYELSDEEFKQLRDTGENPKGL
jgi:hypothetical protein